MKQEPSYSELFDLMMKIDMKIDAYLKGQPIPKFKEDEIEIETAALEIPPDVNYRDIEDIIYDLNKPNIEE